MSDIPRKKEPANVKGTCVKCNVNIQMSRGGGLYRALCRRCHLSRYDMLAADRFRLRKKSKKYIVHKKTFCEECGFVAVHSCQLDVDHMDGNHANDASENLKTLCANCHRLKTFLAKDWQKNK